MGNYKQLALDIQKRAGMNNQEIVENPLGCSTKRIKLPWFLVHREANEFPQKEQELCWLLALPYPESYKAKIAFPSIQQILSKSVPLCGKNLLRQDRSENLQCPVAFKCFCIKRKALFFLWIERYFIRCNAGRFPAWLWLDSRQSTALLISSASEPHLNWPVIFTQAGGQRLQSNSADSLTSNQWSWESIN